MHLTTKLLPVLSSISPDDFDFDYAQRVPVFSIVCMVLSIILALAIPVLLFFYLKRRFKLEPQSILYALMGYMIGGYLLPAFTMIGLNALDAKTGIFSSNTTLYYVLMMVLTVAIEVLTLYLCMKLIHRRTKLTLGVGLVFALIYSIVPIMTQTVSYLGNYISVSMTINQGGLYDAVANMLASEEGAAADAAEQIAALLDSITFLFKENGFYYILITADVLIMMLIHGGVCAMLAGLVQKTLNRTAAYAVLIVELLYMLTSALRYTNIVSSLALIEFIYLILAAFALFAAYKLYKQQDPDAITRLFGKPDPALSSKKKQEPPKKMPKIVMPKD